MFKDEFEMAANGAASKANLLKKNPIGYFLLSMLAGAFIGFGILLIFTIGGQLGGAPATKTVMGASFGIALSLVVICGAELFTGNNLVMTAGVLKKKTSIFDAIKVWIVCYLGNWAGAVVLALIYNYTGLAKGAVGTFMANGALGKMSATAPELFTRAILCNMLVCLAVWSGFRAKSDSAKLIMVFWCLFAFITSGFEHSIANMTLLTEALLNPCGVAVTTAGYFHNLLWVTLGNMVGGILFIAVPYYVGAREK